MSEDLPPHPARTPAPRDLALAELPGLHGSFVFPERLLQQIWLRGEFDRRSLRLRDGRPLALLRRGRWNRLPGPDFRDAEIRLGDAPPVRGDIEVHLRAADWDQHGHARDQAYENVVLHVVLFPSTVPFTAGARGRPIPILELLPLLERDLEAYAEESAVHTLAGRPYSQLRAALAATRPETLAADIARHAARRWSAKVALARRRIGLLGWDEACHHSALEVLGYRPNRAPMLAVAERWPLHTWRTAPPTPAEALAFQPEAWQRAGVRPANQPAARLAQYARWLAARPAWPATLAGFPPALAAAFPLPGPPDLRARRRLARLPALRARLAANLAADEFGGTRLDTFLCDAAFPLLAARDAESAPACEAAWRDWPPGDAPAELLRLAREFGVGASPGGAPLAQGDLQGLLGWLAALLAKPDQPD